MSDGGPGRASLGVEVSMSSQKWSVPRSAVRSIAWLDLSFGNDWVTVVGLRLDMKTITELPRQGASNKRVDARKGGGTGMIVANHLDVNVILVTSGKELNARVAVKRDRHR